jgi:hypothetical protein
MMDIGFVEPFVFKCLLLQAALPGIFSKYGLCHWVLHLSASVYSVGKWGQ